MTFYVIEKTSSDGPVLSYSAKTESSEEFATLAKAEKRAKELAESSPGQTIEIAEVVSRVICSIGKPVVTAA